MEESDLYLKLFCKNIKALREEYHITKKDMATIMGISAVSLNKIEAGIMPKISVSALLRVMYAFRISADKLFRP